MILEDGTGTVSGANSYVSYAAAIAYLLEVGVVPTQTQLQVEEALIRATRYLDHRYTWKGCKLLPESQPLAWPRQGVWTPEGIYIEGLPPELVKANIELGHRALTADLSPDPTFDASGVAVVKSRDKVGPIEVEREFSGGSASSSFAPNYPEVTALLRRLIVNTAGRVYRA